VELYWQGETGVLEELYWLGETGVLGEQEYWWNCTGRGKQEYWGKNPVALSLCAPQILLGLARNRTRLQTDRTTDCFVLQSSRSCFITHTQ